MTARRLTMVAGLLAILIVAPGAADARLSGPPATGIEWLLLASAIAGAVATGLVPPRRQTGAAVAIVVAGLILLKAYVAWTAPAAGWRGVYFMDASTRVDFKAGLFTRPFRRDPDIQFERAGFGLHFLNDVPRYSRDFSGNERQFEYPLRVEWTGYVWLESSSTLRLQFAGRGLGSAIVDGQQLFEFDLDEHRGPSERIELPGGVHHFLVTYTKPALHDATFGFRVFQDDRPIVPSPYRQDAPRLRWLRTWQLASDATVCLGLLILTAATVRAYRPPMSVLVRMRDNASLAGAGTVALGFTVLLLLYVRLKVVPLGTAAANLYSGDDPLAYEGSARDILFHGLLMPNGAAVGHGAPFYFYPLYSYVLAFVHVMLGEHFAAVAFFNVLSIASILLLCWHLGWRTLAPSATAAGVALLGLFAAWHLMPYTVTAFSDNLFISAVFIALLCSTRGIEHGTSRWLLAAGVSAAWAAAARPSFLTYAGVFPLAVMLFGGTSWLQRARTVSLFLVGFAGGLAPFALRNWIVARKVVLLVNSWIQIPYFLYPWGQKNPVNHVAGLPDALATAVEIVRTQPAMVAEIEARKAVFTLGFTQAGPAGVGAHWDLVILFVLFVAALALRKVPRPLAIALGAFAVSHLLAMVMAAPWTYGYKTILPLHAVFLFGSIYLVSAATSSVGSREGRPSGPPAISVPRQG